MRVLVTTPYGVDSLQGNTVSAKRIASLLNEEGLDAEVVSDGDDFSNTHYTRGKVLILSMSLFLKILKARYCFI